MFPFLMARSDLHNSKCKEVERAKPAAWRVTLLKSHWDVMAAIDFTYAEVKIISGLVTVCLRGVKSHATGAIRVRSLLIFLNRRPNGFAKSVRRS